MPLYDYKCPVCGEITELFSKIRDMLDIIDCPACGDIAWRIISVGHGGIQGDEPVWLDDSVRGALQDEDEVRLGREPRIETRSDYKRHLRDRGIAEI